MGKKSRRKPRQVKLTLDDLDDDTAKPAPPLSIAEIHAKSYKERYTGPLEREEYKRGLYESWRSLSEVDRRAYIMAADEMQKEFELTVAFCAKSGPDLVGQLFLDCRYSMETAARSEMRVVCLAGTAWEESMCDKDVRVHYVVDNGDSLAKGVGRISLPELQARASPVSLRELRARACGDARAARKAARRSYEFVSADDFDSSTGPFRWPNGRVLSNGEQDTIVSALKELSVTEEMLCDVSNYQVAVEEYSKHVILARHVTEGIYGALKAVKKWSRVQPHWKRIRRRICTHCFKRVDLTEPRYLVCSGCGDARYCSEACQRKDWAAHQKECPAGQPGWNAAVDPR